MKKIKLFTGLLLATMLISVATGCGTEKGKSNVSENNQVASQDKEQGTNAVSIAGKDEKVKSDSSWYMLNPMADEWTLSTANEFLGFIELISQGSGSMNFEGKTIKLGADLVFNEGKAATWEIGSDKLINLADYQISKPSFDAAFRGIFDGQNHKISGLYIYRIQDEDESPDGAAIFLYTAHDAKIKNLNIENSYIEGTRYVGGVIGQVGGAVEVENIDVKATLKARVGEAGGLAGDLSHKAMVKTSTFDCEIHSQDGVSPDGDKEKNGSGGLIGSIFYADTKKEKSLTLKDVTIKGKIDGYQSGGVIGVVRNISRGVAFDFDNVNIATEITGKKTGNIVGAFQEYGDYKSISITDTFKNVYTLDNGLKDIGTPDTLKLLNEGTSLKKTVAEMK